MNINTALAQALINEQFPHCADKKITPVLPGGWDNRTFRLGDDMLIRLPSGAAYADKVAKEQHWLPLLAQSLKLEIPAPVAMGKPSELYPWPWSVYRWIEGKTVAEERDIDKNAFAQDIASFLLDLQSIDASEGPLGSEHSFYRGASLAVYDEQTQEALALLKDKIDAQKAKQVWASALKTEWQKPPVWVHGDVSIGNLIMNEGRLSAVIDFGGLCTGDPACDLAIAWTYLDEESRSIFKSHLNIDEGTWIRGAAWALWKALILQSGLVDSNEVEKQQADQVAGEVLKEF